MGPFFHYTCSHGAEGIVRDGLVRPGADMGVQFLQARWAAEHASTHRHETRVTHVT